jgi:hypothetical protein
VVVASVSGAAVLRLGYGLSRLSFTATLAVIWEIVYGLVMMAVLNGSACCAAVTIG